jgi:hypothetical protein
MDVDVFKNVGAAMMVYCKKTLDLSVPLSLRRSRMRLKTKSWHGGLGLPFNSARKFVVRQRKRRLRSSMTSVTSNCSMKHSKRINN